MDINIMKNIPLIAAQSVWLLYAVFSSIQGYSASPLIELTTKPNATQLVKPQQSNLVFYTLTNHTNINLPLRFTFSHQAAALSSYGNTCGHLIMAKTSCDFAVQFQAPTGSQMISVKMSIDYQGRAPLQDTIHYRVDDQIVCTLLEKKAYQTKFCQNQYQQILRLTSNVFNISNQAVQQEQSLGGIFGVYQQADTHENICYVSCGQRQLNGTSPDENTLFELASVTKTFTTAILGKLIYKQWISPTESVVPYLPSNSWNGEQYHLTDNESSVTFQQLASFSGGICFSDAPSVNLSTANQTINQSNFVRDINLINPVLPYCLDNNSSNVKPAYGMPYFLPTLNFYSNSSVGLLAQILMNIDNFPDVFQADFNGWICNNITAVLDMAHTNGCLPQQALSGHCTATGSFCNTNSWSAAEYSRGYHISANHYEQGAPFPYAPWAGAGALRSNAHDMINYLRANLGFSTNNNADQLELIQGMMIAHQPNDYLPVPSGKATKVNIGSQFPLVGGQGYAWVCETINADVICGKIGGHTNYRSFVGFNKSKSYGLVILFNTGATSTNGRLNTQDMPPTISQIGVDMMKAGQSS